MQKSACHKNWRQIVRMPQKRQKLAFFKGAGEDASVPSGPAATVLFDPPWCYLAAAQAKKCLSQELAHAKKCLSQELAAAPCRRQCRRQKRGSILFSIGARRLCGVSRPTGNAGVLAGSLEKAIKWRCRSHPVLPVCASKVKMPGTLRGQGLEVRWAEDETG
jgi:hypothetical protein